ncbi:unnamed protein product [Protopolystoma xenopodis]|uniref:Uncharacterized protein n=1 Tax=Protopolystoma xenopodis TaxID=117903 RepID=A0A3S4ZIT3_9PLAT|nr:unnamed protein product [Protopolystoma xenopodis]
MSTAYFWQYNAQCKGPKAVRLIGEHSLTTAASGAAFLLSSTQAGPGVYLHSNDGLPVHAEAGGQRSCLVVPCPIAPHSLPGYPLVVFEDPVQKRHDLVHCSKLRRGDGNDVTPNLSRLRAMGEELDRLSGQIARQGEIILAGAGIASTVATTAAMAGGEPSPCASPSTTCSRSTSALTLALPSASALVVQQTLAGLSTQDQAWCVEEAKREKNKLASK